MRGATGMIASKSERERWQRVPGLPIKAGGAGPNIPVTRVDTVQAVSVIESDSG